MFSINKSNQTSFFVQGNPDLKFCLYLYIENIKYLLLF